MALSEGIGMNQFVATAVAEKLAVLKTANYIAERKGRADLAAFKRVRAVLHRVRGMSGESVFGYFVIFS